MERMGFAATLEARTRSRALGHGLPFLAADCASKYVHLWAGFMARAPPDKLVAKVVRRSSPLRWRTCQEVGWMIGVAGKVIRSVAPTTP